MSNGWFNWLSSSSESAAKKSAKQKPKTKYEEWLEKYDELSTEERFALPMALGLIAGSVSTLAYLKFHARFLRRYETHEWITPDLFVKKRWIKGIVTSVGDPDGFRLYHTPGLVWRWRWKGVPQGMKALKDQTISIRLAGIDAPEFGHFNKESQPFSQEALDWLKSMVSGRVVYCQLLKRDQYTRAVADVMLPKDWMRYLFLTFLTPRFGTPLAHEMLRAGLAVTYQDAGAVYGQGGLEKHLAIEAEAKKKKRGQWINGSKVETPSEYKRRHRLGSASEESTPEPDLEAAELSGLEETSTSGKKSKLKLGQFFTKSK